MHHSAHFVAGNAGGAVSPVFRTALPLALKWLECSADCDSRRRPLSGRRWVSIELYRCFSTGTVARMCGRIKAPLDLICTRGHRGLAHSRWRCHKTGTFLRDHGPVVKDLHGTGGSRSSGFGAEFRAFVGRPDCPPRSPSSFPHPTFVLPAKAGTQGWGVAHPRSSPINCHHPSSQYSSTPGSANSRQRLFVSKISLPSLNGLPLAASRLPSSSCSTSTRTSVPSAATV